jgi:hypothetical protein
MSAASAVSALVNAAKSLSARPPRSLQVFSPPGVAGASLVRRVAPQRVSDVVSAEVVLEHDHGRLATREAAVHVAPRPSCSRQKEAKATSKSAICSWRWTSSARHA